MARQSSISGLTSRKHGKFNGVQWLRIIPILMLFNGEGKSGSMEEVLIFNYSHIRNAGSGAFRPTLNKWVFKETGIMKYLAKFYSFVFMAVIFWNIAVVPRLITKKG